MDTNEKPKLEEAGAFWIKTSKTGNQFLTGKVKSKSGEEISIMVFKNKYKEEGSKQPDYRVYYDSNPPKNNDPILNPDKEVSSLPKEEKTSSKKEDAKKQDSKKEEIPF
jgi:uncharacterized protein (DUF736 family)